jgi:hypothetical protein
MARTRHKGITRVEFPDKHMVGYYVRVAWGGKHRAKFVSDTRYGDRLAALDAAIQLRDQFERELGKPRTEHLIAAPTEENVSRNTGIRRIKEGHTWYWVATYSPEPGRRRTTRYSETKHGPRKAEQLARRFRREGERRRKRNLMTKTRQRPE